MIKSILIKSFFVSVCMLLLLKTTVHAQDTSKRKTIDITSTFKPVLRDAVKINFQAAPPLSDTSRPKLSYNIPSQYLFLNYQPTELKPVALQVDSTLSWENSNYIKAGFGNVHQPYIQTGFSFGDGKNTFFNIYADEFASKGNLTYQKNNFTKVAVTGTVKTQNNLEWSGKVGFKSDGYFLYGYQPDTLKYTKDQVKQTFQTFGGRLALRNLIPTEFGLTYNPNIDISVFNDNHSSKATEANTVINLPLEKSIGDDFAFDLGLTGNLTNYRLNGNAKENNIFYVSPSLAYKTSSINFHAGVTPSWDQKTFHILPEFTGEITPSELHFTIQLGWVGHYDKGSYQRFESINPWLAQPSDSLLNTRVQEGYIGIKGSLNNHVTYAVKAGLAQYWNMPLFVNDNGDGKTFLIRYESNMKALLLHGEIGYTVGENFNATAGLTVNHYGQLHDNAEAWGLLPVELTTTLRWQVLKDLWLKGDLWAFNGAKYLGSNGAAYNGQSGLDANAGVEFKITKQLNLWLQMNNLFNSKYERWHQYQVYGFNILGGIVFSFWQK